MSGVDKGFDQDLPKIKPAEYQLPTDVFEQGMKLAKGSILYGVPIENLSKEELMAVAALSFKAINLQREEHANNLKMFLR